MFISDTTIAPLTMANISGAVRSIMILNSVHVLKRTLNVLLVFFMCDIFNFLSGVSFFCYGNWTVLEPVEKSTWISFGKGMLLIWLMSGLCNFLARFGISIWNRCFLVPYMVFLVMLLAYVLIELSQSVSSCGVKEVDLFSLLPVVIILYIWQTMVRQWIYNLHVPPQANCGWPWGHGYLPSYNNRAKLSCSPTGGLPSS